MTFLGGQEWSSAEKIGLEYLTFLFFFFLIGVLIHIDDPACQLNDLLFVVPVWVYQLLAHVVTQKDVESVDGIIRLAELENLVREGSGEVNVTSDLMPQILK